MSKVAKSKLAAITKAAFQSVADEMRDWELKRETIAKVRDLASLLCKEAMALVLMTVNYGQLVQLPKEYKIQQLPFDTAQLKAL